MRCERCGDTMRPETTIKLRRGFLRVRAEQSEGAFCTTCGISASHGGRATVARLVPVAWMRHALGQQAHQ